MQSLERIGIDLRKHDFKLEEDNWESPTLGAWGIGWQVMLDGLEISQFTYFQQCGGIDLDVVPVELTYGLERLVAFLQNVEASTTSSGTIPGPIATCVFRTSSSIRSTTSRRPMWRRCGRSSICTRPRRDGCSTELRSLEDGPEKQRFPLLAAYDQVLKCSHLFNILDARGAISVTERVAVIQRVRALAVGVAAGLDGAEPAQRGARLMQTAEFLLEIGVGRDSRLDDRAGAGRLEAAVSGGARRLQSAARRASRRWRRLRGVWCCWSRSCACGSRIAMRRSRGRRAKSLSTTRASRPRRPIGFAQRAGVAVEDLQTGEDGRLIGDAPHRGPRHEGHPWRSAAGSDRRHSLPEDDVLDRQVGAALHPPDSLACGVA